MKSLSKFLFLTFIVFNACELKKKKKDESVIRTEALVNQVASFDVVRSWEGNQEHFEFVKIGFSEKAELPVGVSNENTLLKSSGSDSLKQEFVQLDTDNVKKLEATIECTTPMCSDFIATFKHPDLAPFQIVRRVFEVDGNSKVSVDTTATCPTPIPSASVSLSARLCKDYKDNSLQNSQLKVMLAVDAVSSGTAVFLTTTIYRDSADNMYVSNSTTDSPDALDLKDDPRWSDVDFKMLVLKNKLQSKDVSTHIYRSFTKKNGNNADSLQIFENNVNEDTVWKGKLSANSLSLIKEDQLYMSEFSWDTSVSRYLKKLTVKGTLKTVSDDTFAKYPRVKGF